jgi:hypothetical protein
MQILAAMIHFLHEAIEIEVWGIDPEFICSDGHQLGETPVTRERVFDAAPCKL